MDYSKIALGGTRQSCWIVERLVYSRQELLRLQNWGILQETVGIKFDNVALLQQALTHPSYANENPRGAVIIDNERLEFLGDSVLNLIVTEELYRNFPGLSEGELTKLRALLINQETLSRHARKLGLGGYLLLGKGEELTGGRERETNLADAFEALVGAIFLDQGIDMTRRFILAQLGNDVVTAMNQDKRRNYKALLQEFTQEKFKQLPVYQVVAVYGPDHAKFFTVEVRLGGQTIGTGSGKSKKTAEMEAARAAWESLNIT